MLQRYLTQFLMPAKGRCCVLHSTQHATHNTQHRTHSTQHTTHNTQHTTQNTQHTTLNTRQTTHNSQHTAHNTNTENRKRKRIFVNILTSDLISLMRTASRCNALQHAATHCGHQIRCNAQQHAATHCGHQMRCNALQHAATHCGHQTELQRTATRCNTSWASNINCG